MKPARKGRFFLRRLRSNMIETDPPTRRDTIVLAVQFASVALECGGVVAVNLYPLVGIVLIVLGGLILITSSFVGAKKEK